MKKCKIFLAALEGPLFYQAPLRFARACGSEEGILFLISTRP